MNHTIDVMCLCCGRAWDARSSRRPGPDSKPDPTAARVWLRSLLNCPCKPRPAPHTLAWCTCPNGYMGVYYV